VSREAEGGTTRPPAGTMVIDFPDLEEWWDFLEQWVIVYVHHGRVSEILMSARYVD
jgi:hypothetical protein